MVKRHQEPTGTSACSSSEWPGMSRWAFAGPWTMRTSGFAPLVAGNIRMAAMPTISRHGIRAARKASADNQPLVLVAPIDARTLDD